MRLHPVKRTHKTVGMKWTCLLVIALIAGCTTLPPQLKEAKARNKANRAKLPMPQQAAKAQAAMAPKARAMETATAKAMPSSQIFTTAPGGIRVEKWTPNRWVASAPANTRLQAAVFNSYAADGSLGTYWEWFNLPYFGYITNTQGRFVTSNVPNVPHLNFRNVPTAAKARATTNAPVPKWFLDADKNIR